jgi:hypothetical protein
MDVRFCRYAPVVLGVVSLAAAGCSSSPASPTAEPAFVGSPSGVTAEPLTVLPEFLDGGGCRGLPPFGVRLSVTVGGGQDLILRRLRFRLVDPFGRTTFPEVIPISSLSASPTMPNSGPIPFPGTATVPIPLPGSATLPTSPIPIPGSPLVEGVLVNGGSSRALPFFLNFGCGVVSEGTLLIDVDAADRTGRSQSSELRVRVSD